MKETKLLNLFVPGRLCLIGEHSDWAGLYRTINASIVPGRAIVTGVEQGIYATAEKSDKFIVESELPIFKGESFECEMDTEVLKQTASEGGFFSYVAGVASYVNEYYKVKGLKIKITKMDLPIKSGLSSSAAICVLIARAFNILYHLHCNTMGEMFIAYYGEQRTPSRCGRLDQACAYGVNPVSMIFDGNEINVKPLKLKEPLYFVISDLNSKKDTVKILADLNKCYPFAETEIEKRTQEALGKDNEKFIKEAENLLENGDVEAYGKLMISYQKNFDEKVAPSCPKELSSPILHSLLSDQVISKWIYGSKGVGSQGDGTIQFLAKDEDAQKQIIKYLKSEKGLNGFPLTLKPQKAIKKAIIPVAGFGTRLFPVTKVLKKDFFPVMDTDGILKPAILILLEQLVQAGIEKICLVIGEDEQNIYDSFFGELSREHYDKLSSEKQKYEDLLESLKNKITYVYQKERKGFGHAVFQCKDFANNEPVLLLLGVSAPLIVNLLGTTNIITLNVYATPISFTIATFFFALAIFKFDFLKVAPIALQRIVDRISDSYIVVNENNIVTDFNETFLDLFKVKSQDIRNKKLEDLFKKFNKIYGIKEDLILRFCRKSKKE